MHYAKPVTLIIKASFINLKLLPLLATAALAIMYSLPSQAAGFSLLNIPDIGSKNLSVGIWYPSNTTMASTPDSLFNQRLAKNAEVSVHSAPLIILSHGYGGWMGSHADTALALAEEGFVVAAPSHTGNTYKDMSSSIDKWLIERPKHVSTIIDYLNQEWRHRSVLKNKKVGVFGFSAGGQTVLSLIGAIPNFAIAKTHCESNPTEFVCAQGMIKTILDAQMDNLPSTTWGSDLRIRAAVIAAPGLGIAYNKPALNNVEVPVQLWSGLLDDRVPHHSNAKPIADALGSISENNWVKNAGHFSFMVQACTQKLKKYEPKTWAFLCVDKEGFDRQKFHKLMNTKIARFFKTHL